MLECIIVQSEKTYVAAAVRRAACSQQWRGAHRCMCPVLPDDNDAGRKATREITAISAMQAQRHLRSISRTSVPPGDIRPGSLPLSHFTVNPIRLEMATLIKKPQILTAQQFILRPLHLRPLTVVVQDSQDGNGICNVNRL